jgi:succinate dehydrogenase hydrophobic anchor subunit
MFKNNVKVISLLNFTEYVYHFWIGTVIQEYVGISPCEYWILNLFTIFATGVIACYCSQRCAFEILIRG